MHLLTGAVPVLSAIIAVLLWSWIVYVTVVRLPFLGHAHARARAFCAGAIACAFLASAVQVGGINAAPLLAAVAPVGGLLAQAGARARMCNAVAVVGKFKEIRKNVVQTDERLHKFIDHEDPEVWMGALGLACTHVVAGAAVVPARAAPLHWLVTWRVAQPPAWKRAILRP